MKIAKWFLIITVAAAIVATAGMATAKEYKGQSVVPYTSLFSSKPSAKVKHEAIEKAKRSAWENYTSSFSMAKQKAYMQMESEFLGQLDQYIVDYTMLGDKLDKDNKTYSVVLRAKINESLVEAKLSSASAAGSQASGDGSYFSFIFVAREASEVKAFDARKTSITKSENKSMATEKSSMSGSEMASGQSSKSMQKVQSGGSTIRKSDKIKYAVTSPQDIDAAMNEILSPAGFEVVDYVDVLAECGGADMLVIKEEFRDSYEISSRTRRSAIKGARTCEVSYFAVGTLDVGMQDTDPVSGLKRVYVSVNAQVWNIEKRLPRKVAAVNSNPFAGVGPDQTVAKKNALKLAATEAAKAIADQLNAKSLN